MSVAENYKTKKEELPSEVKLIAVSKTKTVEDIKEVYDAGCRDFGENKVQELLNKYDKLPEDIKWHLIGHLQTNKVKYLPNLVYLIHSLDSIKLLNEIEKQFSKVNKEAKVLIQINIGNEEAKTGLNIKDLDELILEIEKCTYVKVKGLMATIPKGDEETCRYYFKKMKEVFENLSKIRFKNISMEYLSMGMSGDYEHAIEEGSNMVRLGSKIFGKRTTI